MSKVSTPPAWQRAIVVLTATVVGTVLICALYLVKEVFIPLALATYLAFLLNPVVRAVESRGPGRVPAVLGVVGIAGLLLAGIVWLVTHQVMGLVYELPNHTPNMRAKIQSLRKLGSGGERFEKMVLDVTQELETKSRALEVSINPAGATRERTATSHEVASSVQAAAPESAWWPWLSDGVTPALGWTATLALAFVLVIFMLLARDDLRSRFLRLTGQGRMPSTTKAVDDASARISRYLLMQFILNSSFGLLVGIGLLFIGVPYAVLWGLLAAVLRYVPYIGPLAAGIFPLSASLVLFPGWWQLFAVIALFLALDLGMNNIIEPWAFGKSMGVSQVGLIVSAAFWFWLWGPVGLILSAPLTVVLAVLGKYVPQLEFLDILLGDEPALAAEMNYYQRLLARDADEATELVLSRLKLETPEAVYDDLLITALNFTKRDRSRDELTESDEEFVWQTTREILEDLGERRIATGPSPEGNSDAVPHAEKKVHLLACPAQDEADVLALQMLQQLLDPLLWDVEITALETLTSELVARIAIGQQPLVCIGSLPPGGLAHTRYLCKRLRAIAPGIKIVVGRWGLKGSVDANREQLTEAGMDHMSTTLIETRRHLTSLHSVLHQKQLTLTIDVSEGAAPALA